MIKRMTQVELFGGETPAQPAGKQFPYTPWIDTACLFRLCEIHEPARFLEVGCNRGATTLALSEQFPAMTIVAIDPGDRVSASDRSGNQLNEYLPQSHIGILAKHCKGVTIVHRRFDELPDIGFFDGILIDGDNRAEAVKHDVRKALGLLRPGGFVAVHDVSNPRAFEVLPAIESLPEEFTHIEGSWLAFCVP